MQLASKATTITATAIDARLVEAFAERLGQFVFTVSFDVAPPQAGYIVQHVVRHAVIDERRGKQSFTLSLSQIDGYSSSNPMMEVWSEYWEVFEVNSSGAAVDDDQFSFTQMDLQQHPTLSRRSLWTMDGYFEVKGTAVFYAGTPPRGVFSPGSTTNPANGLPWTLTDPTSSLPSPGSSAVEHSAKITWVGQKKGHTTLVCKIAGVDVYSETL